MKNCVLKPGPSLLALLLIVSPAQLPAAGQAAGTGTAAARKSAETIVWADWTESAPSVVTGLVGDVAVTYSGAIHFAQTAGGGNFWQPDDAYVSEHVLNGPATSDIITAGGGDALPYTITFARPVTDPVMAVCSLGSVSLAAAYVFDTPVEILSDGPGYWGDGELVQSDAYTIGGAEAHGVLRFPGTHTSISWQNPVLEIWSGITIGVAESDLTAVPEVDHRGGLRLGCHPNPFNPATTIRYDLPDRCRVTLRLYDAAGRLVLTLRSRIDEEAGPHEVVWRGRDASGRPAPSGAYYFRLDAGSDSETGRMALIR